MLPLWGSCLAPPGRVVPPLVNVGTSMTTRVNSRDEEGLTPGLSENYNGPGMPNGLNGLGSAPSSGNMVRASDMNGYDGTHVRAGNIAPGFNGALIATDSG